MKTGYLESDLITAFPLYSEDLGIDISSPEGRFKWFIASILFGARISEKIAMNTYRTFEKYGLVDPEKIIEAGWDELVRVLGEGGYARYDFSTATKLRNIMKEIKVRYGSLENIYALSKDTADLRNRLMEFKGIGEVTSQIFLRELRGIWDIDLPVSQKAGDVAEALGIDLADYEGEYLARMETALVKIYIREYKKNSYKGN